MVSPIAEKYQKVLDNNKYTLVYLKTPFYAFRAFYGEYVCSHLGRLIFINVKFPADLGAASLQSIQVWEDNIDLIVQDDAFIQTLTEGYQNVVKGEKEKEIKRREALSVGNQSDKVS